MQLSIRSHVLKLLSVNRGSFPLSLLCSFQVSGFAIIQVNELISANNMDLLMYWSGSTVCLPLGPKFYQSVRICCWPRETVIPRVPFHNINSSKTSFLHEIIWWKQMTGWLYLFLISARLKICERSFFYRAKCRKLSWIQEVNVRSWTGRCNST